MTKKVEPSATGPFRARVWKSDFRRGLATLIDERGRRIRVTWEILQHSPTLLRGMAVEVLLDADDVGRAKKITVVSDTKNAVENLPASKMAQRKHQFEQNENSNRSFHT